MLTDNSAHVAALSTVERIHLAITVPMALTRRARGASIPRSGSERNGPLA